MNTRDAATERRTVAVLGMGRMGSAMARALARSGLALVLWNRSRDRAEGLAAELGARVAASPSEAASIADVSLTMLADDAAVAAVYTGPDGLLAGTRPGVVLVDLSTVTPDSMKRIAPLARAAGAGVLDSPVSGSVTTAESGQLTLMVGGNAEDVERARFALQPLAKTIIHVGPLGAGAAMKLAVNTVIFGLNAAVAEALVLAEAAGVDRALAYDVIASSAVGAPFVAYKRDAFVAPDTAPTAFALDLAEKDLRLIIALAGQLGLELPQARSNLAGIRAAAGDLGGDRDFASVAVHVRSRRATPAVDAPAR